MCQRFCHVHNHTEYSLLDGANRIPQMVARAKDLEMEALAITDHGVMFGVMEFYFEAKKAGIKPLLGVEAYVAPGGHRKKDGRQENENFHLLLLAKDLEGYRNLCRLSTIAALEGYYYRPRIDHELLAKHSKGVIATSACLSSEICRYILRGDYEKAEQTAGFYTDLFGRDNFFIEIQDHGLEDQRFVMEPLKKIAKGLSLGLVATNDAHYLCEGDAKPHDVLLCIQSGKQLADEDRMRFDTNEFYLKTKQQMADLFPNDQEALENTLRIAEMCDVQLDKTRAPMPQPDVPEGLTSIQHLRHLAERGLKDRAIYSELKIDRLNYELDVISRTGFEDYFLLVREFAHETRRKGIYFGVRGSAAGSLVSYAIGITDVDPIEFDLTFERFLNPERISMPDIDMDFEDARRDEIIQYVADRFGKDHVAQIVTFGTLGAKAAIKDCGRVMGYSPQDTDRLSKMIPTVPGWSLKRAFDEVAEFRETVSADSKLTDLYETALSVEGIARHAGVHAAGVVISREPLVDYLPLYRGTDGQAVTAFEMGVLEKIGLLKMDFLGLSNLTVLARCVENVNRGLAEGAQPLDVQSIPFDDVPTFEMLGRGETIGVFQLEGGGMTRWVQQLKPVSVRELAAMIALYRPGPMEHIPQFIATKFGRREPEYLDDRMRPILEETYGIIVYQDQVLKLVQALAGFSLGKADILRRAMGKKDAHLMAQMKTEFMEGAREQRVAQDVAERVWELLLPFAGYAFNKAHAVCYSILAYQTAYLKANYRVEYMAALLSVYLSKEEKVTAFIEECRKHRIPVLQPDVNASLGDFAIVPHKAAQAILFGMVAIKGVGEGLVQGIVAERSENGPFRHLYEFCERVRSFSLTKTSLEALIRAGALDSIDVNRNRLLNHVEAALQFADNRIRMKLDGQDSLFISDASGPEQIHYPSLPDEPAPTKHEMLAMEKEVMGIYVSDHPLRGVQHVLPRYFTHSTVQALEVNEGERVKLAGVLVKVAENKLKKSGEVMATLTLEDMSGQVTVVAYPKVYDRLRAVLKRDALVQLMGSMERNDRRGEGILELRLDNAMSLQVEEMDDPLAFAEGADGLVTIAIRKATETQIRKLRRTIETHPGSHVVLLQIVSDANASSVYLQQLVEPSPTLEREVKASLGRCDYSVTSLI